MIMLEEPGKMLVTLLNDVKPSVNNTEISIIKKYRDFSFYVKQLLFLALTPAENTEEYNAQHNKGNDNIELYFSIIKTFNEKDTKTQGSHHRKQHLIG